MTSLADLEARLSRLRPRDRDVVRGLIEHVSVGEKEVADKIGMSVSTLKARLRHVYVVLEISSRVELYARYHGLFTTCDCFRPPS